MVKSGFFQMSPASEALGRPAGKDFVIVCHSDVGALSSGNEFRKSSAGTKGYYPLPTASPADGTTAPIFSELLLV